MVKLSVVEPLSGQIYTMRAWNITDIYFTVRFPRSLHEAGQKYDWAWMYKKARVFQYLMDGFTRN